MMVYGTQLTKEEQGRYFSPGGISYTKYFSYLPSREKGEPGFKETGSDSLLSIYRGIMPILLCGLNQPYYTLPEETIRRVKRQALGSLPFDYEFGKTLLTLLW